jgi:membrane protease YdiL (CAAX protease family)
MTPAITSGGGLRDAPSVERRSLVPAAAFVALTFGVSWALFLAGRAESPARPILILLGTIAPSLVALALTASQQGRAGAIALLRRILNPPAAAKWYVFAAAYMAAVKLAVAMVHRTSTGEWPQFGTTPVFVMVLAILVSTPVQAGEEIGWRGYALPRLAGAMGLPLASVVLGVIWAAWHLPFFFMPAADLLGQSFPLYLLQVTALSVAMAWLYWRACGTLLPVMVMHAAVNNTKDIVPSAAPGAADPFTLQASLVGWLTVAVLCACAVYFLVRMRGARLAA